MTKKNNSINKLVSVLDKVIDMFEKFVTYVDNEVIDPLTSGKASDDEMKTKLKKLGNSASPMNITKIITKTIEVLVSTKIKADENLKNREEEFDIEKAAADLDQKLLNLHRYRRPPEPPLIRSV